KREIEMHDQTIVLSLHERKCMNIYDALKDTSEGAVYILDKARQLTLLLKLPEDVDFEAHTPMSYGQFEWYEYQPEGAIIRTLVSVYKDLKHLESPLVYFDIFFNPNNQSDHELMERMSTAGSLRCMACWNDADLTYLGQKQLRWDEQYRKASSRLLELSRG